MKTLTDKEADNIHQVAIDIEKMFAERLTGDPASAMTVLTLLVGAFAFQIRPEARSLFLGMFIDCVNDNVKNVEKQFNKIKEAMPPEATVN